ncbi:MAG: ABC transporter substrate-binding protein, partial [Chloroflexi bacterium]|nr:ABC transporter substrate-binding protein [Chloroflexota bacterium]
MGTAFWPELMKKNGVNIVETVSFNSVDPSVAAQVTKLKAANPQAVILAASPGEAAKIAIEIQRQGMKTQLLGAGGLFGDEFVKAGCQAVEGAITAAQYWR